MSYVPDFMPVCQKTIEKAIRKNPLLRKIITKKINQIILNPYHYKPLRNILAGERRVHILKSFVLSFIINETNQTVIFVKFSHHDKAY